MDILISVRGILFNKSKEKILIFQRNINERHDKLKWEFVGGRPNHNSESFEEVLIREFEEETGLDNFSFLSKIPYISTFQVEHGVYTGYRFIQIIYPCQVDFTEDIVISSEHESWKWIYFQDFEIAEMSLPIQKCGDSLKKYILKIHES